MTGVEWTQREKRHTRWRRQPLVKKSIHAIRVMVKSSISLIEFLDWITI